MKAPVSRPVAPVPSTVSGALHVCDLSLLFGGLRVLNEVSAAFQAGQISGLIGPNGAGKTSFFNCLTGLYAPQHGTITLGDVRIEHLPPTRRAALGFARSFQHMSLCSELTLAENVALGVSGASWSGWLNALLPLGSGDRQRARNLMHAREALALLGIEHAAESMPAELPPGTLRLAEIARAMVGQPRVLLLDEPAAGLNSAESRELAQALKRLRHPDLILIVVEHDMELVMEICDWIHVLSAGRLLASGTPHNIRQDPDVIDVYLGVEDA